LINIKAEISFKAIVPWLYRASTLAVNSGFEVAGDIMSNNDIGRCFGCGADNPSGLHLKKGYSGDRAHIEFKVEPEYTGYPGLLHGGVTCVLFDEVMYHAIARDGTVAVIANLNVDYRSPALVGDLLVCEGTVVRHEGRKINVAATIVNERTGAMVAEGKALFIEVDLDKLLVRAKPSAGPSGRI
jgi:uncharacterized protein (TIGR00369 family)